MFSVLKDSPTVDNFNLSHLLTEMKQPTFIEEDQETVRVNESVGETSGQFAPPSNFNNTPVVPDDQIQSQSLGRNK